jgi:hypothetical protein
MHSRQRGGSFGKVLFTLLAGGAIGAGVCYYLLQERGRNPSATDVEQSSPTAPAERVSPPEAPTRPAEAPANEDYIARKLREWKLTPDDLKRDLATAGDVVREKSRVLGDKVAGATSDVAIIGKIKLKYALDDRLKALDIKVGCKSGHVTLGGSVASAELIGRAIVLALDTDGVIDVVSSLKVAVNPEPV